MTIPDGVKYHLLAAREAWEAGEYAAVVEACGEALKEDATCLEAYGRRGHARSKLGDRDGAIADFDHIIDGDLDPGALRFAHFHRGKCHYALGDDERALADFEAAVRRRCLPHPILAPPSPVDRSG